MLKFMVLLWDHSSMHFPEFQGSGLTCTDFPDTFHLGGDSANHPDRSLRNRANPIRAAMILIYEFSRDKLLGMELSGCRWQSSVVKQMWGKPFLQQGRVFSFCNLLLREFNYETWYGSNKLDSFGMKIRTKLTLICWQNVCTCMKILLSTRVHAYRTSTKEFIAVDQMEF